MLKRIQLQLKFLSMIALLSVAFACSNEDDSVSDNSAPKGEMNARQQQSASHTLTIVNNSSYTYEINAIGAQRNFDIGDNIEILHKNSTPMVLGPHSKVSFYDYGNASDSQFNLAGWEVYDNNLENTFVGYYASSQIAHLYGIEANPAVPDGIRYPVWKFMDARILDPVSNQPLAVLGGNNPESSFAASLGDFDMGYNSVLKYGIYRDGPIARRPEGTEIQLVMVKWNQSGENLKHSANIKISIENTQIR